MAHNCVDWSVHPPARKTPLLVLTHGDEHVYTTVPKDLKTLQEIARREFNLGDVDVSFLSPCASLCHGRPARITEDAWEHISPYIGCATVQVSRIEDQPQDEDEQYFSAKRKPPAEEHEDDQQHPRTSSTEDDEELSRSPVRPRARRRLVSEEEDEQEPATQTTQPPPGKEIKQERVGGPSASQPSEPGIPTGHLPPADVPVKQEKPTTVNASQSTHTESDTQTQADGEKLMIRVAHPPSNQEAKFMTKSSTSVGKVLSGACKSFSLDVNLATLFLIVSMEDEGGKMVDLKFPCDNKDTISRAGAESNTETRFMLKIAGEA